MQTHQYLPGAPCSLLCSRLVLPRCCPFFLPSSLPPFLSFFGEPALAEMARATLLDPYLVDSVILGGQPSVLCISCRSLHRNRTEPQRPYHTPSPFLLPQQQQQHQQLRNRHSFLSEIEPFESEEPAHAELMSARSSTGAQRCNAAGCGVAWCAVMCCGCSRDVVWCGSSLFESEEPSHAGMVHVAVQVRVRPLLFPPSSFLSPERVSSIGRGCVCLSGTPSTPSSTYFLSSYLHPI